MCKSTGARCPFSPPPIQHNGMAHYAHHEHRRTPVTASQNQRHSIFEHVPL
ncbi:hypothetical protein AH715_005373 [Salmonella enterica subsp. enterica]|nr:hypothetical protein [Salmonella enterica subsp. enterica]EEJ7262308.1 hypothetical protein [Salmonella enterica subsp. enterica]